MLACGDITDMHAFHGLFRKKFVAVTDIFEAYPVLGFDFVNFYEHF